MSENVIEQQIKEWLRAEEIYDVGEVGVAYGDCARQLQAATRPEQFMPPLNCWPMEAQWCAIGPEGLAFYYPEDSEPVLQYLRSGACWQGGFVFCDSGVGGIPLGIDWRLCKVSRKQMEEWGESNET